MKTSFKIMVALLVFFLVPFKVSAATIQLDKGSVYKLKEASTYKSTKSSVVTVYPSGICKAVNAGSAKVNGKSFVVRNQAGYILDDTASFSSSTKKVTLKAKSGYKVYYTVNKAAYAPNKAVKSSKSKTFTFNSTSELHVYAVKSNAKINMSDLKKKKDSQNDNCFLYTKYMTPSYTVPTGLSAVYGSNVSSIKLPGGFSWVSEGKVGNAGENTLKVKFTPSDTMKYRSVSGISVTVAVKKANPSYSVLGPFNAVFEDKIEDIALPSGFEWESEGTIKEAGEHTYYVTYTPDDTKNYNVVEHIPVTIKAAEKSIEGYKINSISAIPYTGNAIKPKVTVSDLKEGEDYTVKYSNNVLPGTATVEVSGKGNYTGKIKGTFYIAPTHDGWIASLKDMLLKFKKNGFSYNNGSAQTSYNKAIKNNKKYFNCATYVSLTLQQMGVLTEGNAAWFNMKGGNDASKTSKGYTEMKANKKRYQIIKTKDLKINNKGAGKDKSMVQLLKAGILKPGDICGFSINGYAAHTAVFAGKTSAGNAKWYSGGNGDWKNMFANGKDGKLTVKPKRFGYYEQSNDYLGIIVRLKY